jgi:hypothetical protein
MRRSRLAINDAYAAREQTFRRLIRTRLSTISQRSVHQLEAAIERGHKQLFLAREEFKDVHRRNSRLRGDRRDGVPR